MRRLDCDFWWVVCLIFSLLFATAGAGAGATGGRAGENIVVENAGLEGEELICLAVSPLHDGLVLLGTKKGLYKKAGGGPWQAVGGFNGGAARVNQIVFSAAGDAYISTENGLYLLRQGEENAENIFLRSSPDERWVAASLALEDGTIFIGTKAGVFARKKGQRDWTKISVPFDNEEVVSLVGSGKVVYAAAFSGVYRSLDAGRRWEKVFSVYAWRATADEDGSTPEDSAQDNADATSPPVKHMICQDSSLYLATSYGVFSTKDSGKTWERLPLAGLNAADLRTLYFDSLTQNLLAVTKTGVSAFDAKTWKSLFVAYDARYAARGRSGLLVVTGRDFFECRGMTGAPAPSADADGGLESFRGEPTIEEVQRMAVAYAEVGNEKIIDWRRRAKIKALMPELSFDYDKTVTTALGATYDRTQIGPNDWGLSLKWDLSELVYNSDQTSIDTRSKLMVELRNDILSEVTRLYFERRKVQLELSGLEGLGDGGLLEKKLRLQELTALIDRLTGGGFSRVLKNLK